MRIKYKEDAPKVGIKVKGPKGEEGYDAYLDTGARKTLIPERDALELGLTYVADVTTITGSGKDAIKLFRAEVLFLGKEFEIFVFGRDLPEQAEIKAIVGRDILDRFKVCFNGRTKEVGIV